MDSLWGMLSLSATLQFLVGEKPLAYYSFYYLFFNAQTAPLHLHIFLLFFF